MKRQIIEVAEDFSELHAMKLLDIRSYIVPRWEHIISVDPEATLYICEDGAEVLVEYRRPETDEELARRKEKTAKARAQKKAQKEEQTAREYAQYLKLKEKYE